MKRSTIQDVIESLRLAFLEIEKEQRSRRIKMGVERRKYGKSKNVA